MIRIRALSTMETLWLFAAALAGQCAIAPVADRMLVRISGQHLKAFIPALPEKLPLWLIGICAPIYLYCYNKFRWLRNERIHATKPAAIYPHRDPVGIDWVVKMVGAIKSGTLLDDLDEIINSFGGTFWHLATGSWILFTNEPDNLKAMLSTRFEEWPIGGVRQRTTQLTVGPHAIFSVNGKEWQSARSLIRPSFTRNQITDLECQGRHVERFLDRIPKDGSAVELQNLLYLFTMDSATDFMYVFHPVSSIFSTIRRKGSWLNGRFTRFGYSTSTLVDPIEENLAFARAFDYCLHIAASRARLGWLGQMLPDKEFDRSMALCKRFMDHYVSKAIADSKTKERPYVFLNEIVDTGISQEQIRDHLMAMIVGGRDTSASTMTAMFWTLARRPDIVSKAREEISSLRGSEPSWEDLKNLKYINMILKESKQRALKKKTAPALQITNTSTALRLWPPVSTNMRCAANDTVLPKGGGHDGQSPIFVPKGTQCRWSLYSLHRRKQSYGDDADKFRPERWETLRTR